MFQQLRKMSEHSASLLLLLLLSADFVFTTLHILIGIFDPVPALCNISGICSYMDIYHLVKLFWVVILFVYLLNSTRYAGYVSWLLMFTVFLLDDTLLLHQKVGDRISGTIDIYVFHSVGLHSRYFELAILAIVGLILLAVVGWSYFHGSQIFRKISVDMLLFIAALIFSGLIVDVAKTIKLGPAIISGLQFVEDAGELLTYSLILWYVFLLALRNGKSELFLHDLLGKSQIR